VQLRRALKKGRSKSQRWWKIYGPVDNMMRRLRKRIAAGISLAISIFHSHITSARTFYTRAFSLVSNTSTNGYANARSAEKKQQLTDDALGPTLYSSMQAGKGFNRYADPILDQWPDVMVRATTSVRPTRTLTIAKSHRKAPPLLSWKELITGIQPSKTSAEEDSLRLGARR